MKTATIQEISSNAQQFEQWLNGGEQVKLMKEGKAIAMVSPVREKAASLRTPPTEFSLGAIIKPWSSRAELLEDFFEREG